MSTEEVFIALFVCSAAVIITKLIVDAFARARRSPGAGLEGGSSVEHRLDRLERAIETVAIEVERIGENQRFQTRLMQEGRPQGLQPVEHRDAGR